MTPDASAADVDFAVRSARDAGARTLDWFGDAALRVDHKADGSPVTAADLAAERHIRDAIADHHADDAVIGEEEGDIEGTTGRTWVIDPIDGTKAFTRGVPLYSVLIALVDEHGPAVGVIHLPGLDETVWAGRGLGAFHNGAPCAVSTRTAPDGAVLTTSGTDYWPRSALDTALDSPLTIRTWGDAYGYTLVATGRAEAMVDPQAFPWDVAPMPVIIAEAGGRFSGIDGSDGWRAGSGVATNGHLHDPVLALFD